MTFQGATPTGASLGGSFSNGARRYTDTPTTIIANERLDPYAGRNTVLAGAGMWSKTGKLKLDTGELVFDNLGASDLGLSKALQRRSAVGSVEEGKSTLTSPLTHLIRTGSIMRNCGWDKIHAFQSPVEFKRFVGWIEAQVKAGVCEELIERRSSRSDCGASPGTFLPLGAGTVAATKGVIGLVEQLEADVSAASRVTQRTVLLRDMSAEMANAEYLAKNAGHEPP